MASKKWVYISIDMEGAAGVSYKSQVESKSRDYERARRWMTLEARAAAEGARSAGAERVVVNDAHGAMGNLVWEELPSYVEVIQGYPKPTCMVAGLTSDYAAAFFLGYHAGRGAVRGFLEHTMSGFIVEVGYRGRAVSELWLNAVVAGERGVPVALVTGDEPLIEEALELIPGVEVVKTKEPLTRYAALVKHPSRVAEEVKEAAAKAFSNAVNGKVKPLEPPKPVELSITFADSLGADVACLAPQAERVDPLTVRLRASTWSELYDLLDLVILAIYAAKRVYA